jgi:ABC-type transport system involved in cytochrome bd biosynthesis fused ATPase/permease subunit
VDYANSDQATGVSTSSEWGPLLEVRGDLKNGTRAQLAINRRVTESENRLNGSSISTDRNTNVSFSLNRSYSKGQKVNILGKETTVKSNINLGLSAAYERQSGETIQQEFGLPQNETKRDRLSLNGQGGYSFSNNVTGNVELGFGQNRDLLRDIVSRNVRVELRAQFTF